MRDWKPFVAERLARTSLPPESQQEIVAEIAEHLQDCEEALREAGAANPEALTLAQVSDWTAFARRIRRAKEDSMAFIRKIVIPGAIAATLALAALKLFVYLLIVPEPCGPDATCIMVSADGPAYLPWLATLPVAGALAAFVARRAGARPGQRLIAALFPAFYLGIETVVMSLLGEFFWRIPIYWVLVPAAACALGAWPFLGNRRGAAAQSRPNSYSNSYECRPPSMRIVITPPIPDN